MEADALADSNQPAEYANINGGVHHIVAFQGITACGRRVKPGQVTTIPDGRLCRKCATTRDWYAAQAVHP